MAGEIGDGEKNMAESTSRIDRGGNRCGPALAFRSLTHDCSKEFVMHIPNKGYGRKTAQEIRQSQTTDWSDAPMHLPKNKEKLAIA